MQRSSSTGALAAAGAAAFTHIPRRATQHSVYLPTNEVLPTTLKPGQASLQRQVYAEEARDFSETFLHPDRPAESYYGTEISKLVKPDDYKSPVQPILQKEPTGGYGHHKAAHWASTSASSHNQAAIASAVYYRQHGPSYQSANPPTCVGQPLEISTIAEYHGKYGETPWSRVQPHHTSMPVFTNALTVGTHKGTKHIPGYSGFIATNTANPQVARVAGGATMRSTDKTNLTEQFHTNLLNYAGHVASNPLNDRGGVKPNSLSMMHRSFTSPKLHAFE